MSSTTQFDEEYSRYCWRQAIAGHTPVQRAEFDLLHWLHSPARAEHIARFDTGNPPTDPNAKNFFEPLTVKKLGCLGGHYWYSHNPASCCPTCGRRSSHMLQEWATSYTDDHPKTLAEMTDAERKALPIFTGVFEYFLDALLEVAAVSKAGNDQHNPGQPLHWAKEKSQDQLNTALRHAAQHGTRDTDGRRHMGKACWRMLAELQLEIEAERAGMTRKEYDEYLREIAAEKKQ